MLEKIKGFVTKAWAWIKGIATKISNKIIPAWMHQTSYGI